jgi:hypothetical protein
VFDVKPELQSTVYSNGCLVDKYTDDHKQGHIFEFVFHHHATEPELALPLKIKYCSNTKPYFFVRMEANIVGAMTM